MDSIINITAIIKKIKEQLIMEDRKTCKDIKTQDYYDLEQSLDAMISMEKLCITNNLLMVDNASVYEISDHVLVSTIHTWLESRYPDSYNVKGFMDTLDRLYGNEPVSKIFEVHQDCRYNKELAKKVLTEIFEEKESLEEFRLHTKANL